MKKLVSLIALAFALCSPAHAVVTVTGLITELSIWKTGAVTFKTSPTVGLCNHNFLVNNTDGGRTLIYMALLQAKLYAQPVTITYSTPCTVMTGVTGSSYITVDNMLLPD